MSNISIFKLVNKNITESNAKKVNKILFCRATLNIFYFHGRLSLKKNIKKSVS